MGDDWAILVFIAAGALIFGAAFLRYVRAGMMQAESEWRAKTRDRFCVRCGCSLRGNISRVCPKCRRPFKLFAR
jgi:hypothetical protein